MVYWFIWLIFIIVDLSVSKNNMKNLPMQVLTGHGYLQDIWENYQVF